jgi:hypothetical protein
MQQPENDPTPPGAPLDNQNPKKRTHPDDFKRAYKACINCRQRKAKCILDATPDGELKPPCQRCKREMRECVFRSERSWVKRRKPGEARDAENDHAGNSTSMLGTTHGPQHAPNQRTSSISVHSMSPHDSVHTRRSDMMSPPATFRRVSTSQPDLAHSVMRTVVSSGSDALNLLFEAAHHRDALENQARVESQAQDTPRSGTSFGLGAISRIFFSRHMDLLSGQLSTVLNNANRRILQDTMVSRARRSRSRRSLCRCPNHLKRRLEYGRAVASCKWDGSQRTRL